MTIYKDLKIGSSVNGTSQRYTYNVTSSVSSVSGADANGNTLAYDSGFADVYLNGVRLSGADITITSGNSVSFASNLSNGDVVDIVAYGAFTVASVNADNLSSGTVPDARITGAYTGITSLTMTGDLTVDTNTLYVKSSNNRIGIGNSNPQNKLDISALTWDDGLLIKNTGNFNVGIIGDANRTSAGGGLLNLQGRWNGTEVTSILFQAGSDTTNKDDGEIIFRTASAGTPTEKVRIESSGNVLVGKTSSNTGTAGLELRATNQGVFTRSGGQPLILNRLTDDGRIIHFKKDNVAVGDINVSGTGISITLGGTGTANELDDYEEGTWSPAISGTSGGASGVTFGDRFGSYVKIGKSVTVQVYINLDSWSSGPSGNLTVGTLPFTSSSTSTFRSSVTIGFTENFSQAPAGGIIANSATVINLKKVNGTSAQENMTNNATASDVSGDEVIMLTATYEV